MKKVAIRLCLAVGLAALVVGGCGHGGESQFSPDSFEHRGVLYFWIPYTSIPVAAIPDERYQEKIVTFWIGEGYFDHVVRQAARWDTIGGWRQFDRSSYGGAAKAFWYLATCRGDEQADEWIEWSHENPKLAARLWPDVVRLVSKGDGESYAHAGALMRWVHKCTDPAEFDRAYDDCARIFAVPDGAEVR
jgi:hypothetical protein